MTRPNRTQWRKPAAGELRFDFGFEITMYIANR